MTRSPGSTAAETPAPAAARDDAAGAAAGAAAGGAGAGAAADDDDGEDLDLDADAGRRRRAPVVIFQALCDRLEQHVHGVESGSWCLGLCLFTCFLGRVKKE